MAAAQYSAFRFGAEPEIAQRFPRARPSRTFQNFAQTGYRDTDPRPTCKVGIIEGEMGARIYPKNCVVRNFVRRGADRAISAEAKYTKSGYRKTTLHGIDSMEGIQAKIFGTLGPNAVQGMQERNRRVLMVYDTGANGNHASERDFVKMTGLTIPQAKTKYFHHPQNVYGVGARVQGTVFKNVRTIVSIPKPDLQLNYFVPGRTYDLGKMDWFVQANTNNPEDTYEGSALLGVRAIDRLRQLGVKVSFREAAAGRLDRSQPGVFRDDRRVLLGNGRSPTETHLRGVI